MRLFLIGEAVLCMPHAAYPSPSQLQTIQVNFLEVNAYHFHIQTALTALHQVPVQKKHEMIENIFLSTFKCSAIISYASDFITSLPFVSLRPSCCFAAAAGVLLSQDLAQKASPRPTDNKDTKLQLRQNSKKKCTSDMKVTPGKYTE